MNPHIDVIGFACKSVPESLRFYRTLGLDVPDDPPEGVPYVQCTMKSGLRVSWNEIGLVAQVYPGWEMPDFQRIMFACNCESPEGVDAAFARVVDAGFESFTKPYDAPFGQRYAVVCDPDGYRVGLYAWLPGHAP